MNKKKIISVLLISLLLINSNSALALAEDASEKEEIVYVNLNDDGTVKDITVVNSFETGSNQTIVDYGDYSSVRNMTSEDLITYESDKISINTTSDKTYYEGKLNSTSIPWKIDIKYVLDGRSVTSGELAGSSGHLKIKLDISKNDAFEGNFYEGYALQVSLSLDSYKCFNITSDGATIANVGSDKQLSYIILPNKGKDITIETDVVDFEYDGISINGVKLNLNIEVDSSELDDKVNEITDAVSKLDDGASDLKDGTKKLYDGALSLYDGANQLASGASTLSSGLSELKSYNNSLNDGASTAFEGLCTLATTIINAQLSANGMDSITLTPSTYSSALNALLEKLDAKAVYDKAYAVAKESVTKQVEEKADELYKGYVDTIADSVYKAYLKTNEDSIYKKYVEDNADAFYQGYATQVVYKQAIESGKTEEEATAYIESNEGKQTIGNVVNNLIDNQKKQILEATLTSLTDDQKNQILAGALLTLTDEEKSQIKEGAVKSLTDDQKAQIRNAYIEEQMVSDAVASQINAAVEQANAAAKPISELKGQLDKYAYFSNSLATYTSKVSEASDGAKTILEGTNKVLDGSKRLKEGTDTLKDGVNDLKDGTSEFSSKTNKLSNEVNNKIDEMIDEITAGDIETTSFVSGKNTNVDAVQFVIKTGGIKKVEETNDTVETNESSSFIDKLLSLFGIK